MICNHCFENEQIKDYIKNYGEKAIISYQCVECNTTNDANDMFTLSTSDLAYKLQEVIANLYTHYNEHGIPIGLSSLNEICWELFEDGDKLSKMIVEHSSFSDFSDGGSLDFTDEYNEAWQSVCFFENDEHTSFNWDKFSEQIKHSLRFFDTEGFNRLAELQKLDNIFSKLECANGTAFMVYRVRSSNETKADIIRANPEVELGKAPARYAGHNRFSPSGISYIYLAYDEETAVSEVYEPDKELYFVGRFELHDGLKLLCLREKDYSRIEGYYGNPFSDASEFDSHLYCNAKSLLSFIKELQKPINNDEKTLEYLPTQVLAEYIKLRGYDGFTFSSSKNEGGTNLVLFEEKLEYKSYKEVKAKMYITIEENS